MKTICERCENVFDPYKDINYNNKDNSWRIIVHYDYHPYPEQKINLCPKCQKELFDWLKYKEKY